MPVVLGCIADDYTGAADLANAIADSGLRAVQTIGVPPDDLELPDVDAIVVALKIRSVEPEEAVSQALAAHDWLSRRGAAHFLFKICCTFDSTDRGNIGPVMDALRKAAGQTANSAPTLVNPAFPETGRSVYMGNLFVGEQLLHESPLKDHPLNPMRDSNLVRVLGRQTETPIGLVPLRVVADGPAAVMSHMTRLSEDGCGAVIADAVLDSQLETLGQAALSSPVSVGASGLGIGLSQALIANGQARRHGNDGRRLDPVGGPAVILAGSCSPATLDQIDAAKDIPHFALDVGLAITDPDAAAKAAVDWAQGQIAGSAAAVLIYSSAPPDAVSALQADHGRDHTGRAIETALAEIARSLTGASDIRRLIVAGGETSGAVVDALGVRALVIGERIAPGVPATRAVWNGEGDLLLTLKSGNFGGRTFFADAMAVMA